MEKIKNAYWWIIKFLRWLIIEPWYWFTGPLALILLPLIVLLLNFELGSTASLVGISYRAIGIIFVIIGLNNKLKGNKGLNILKIPSEWYANRPKKRKLVIIAPKGIYQKTRISEANMKKGLNLEELTTDEKFSHVFSKLDKQDKVIQDIKRQYEKKINDLKSEISQLEDSGENKYEELKSTIRNKMVSDYKLELFGALSVLIGLFYSGIAAILL